ncbi:50S ribosomal protein L9 [Candidatus Parcubacteria bacterium]|nr:50S ribosomal protein L9 [Candidatus Parcubacteria bacterium]
MKIVLLKDIHGIGKKYDAVTVADGFALNNIIPKNYAEYANDSVVLKYAKLKEAEGENRKMKEEEVIKNLDEITSKTYSITAKANEQGHLFAALHKEQLADALHIDSHFIASDKNIKEVGDHEITLKVRDIEKVVKLSVVAE